MEILKTTTFDRWLAGLKDRRAKVKINARLLVIQEGGMSDVKSLGRGLWETRIHYGPGYRLYYVWRGQCVIVLLCGGDKSSQVRDIKRAREVARYFDE
ncbi:MAG TPA: type II toxin-antitoxin system RelE/ParE family toxin [Alcanivorax sp.]|nr:type II toxin-antitoxin system RelE/ParE family toxin [Alcanivorax sp.]